MDIAPEVREAINNYKTYHRDDFIEKNFAVVNKDMKVVPLIPTLAQRYYWRTRTPRDIYLKARQVRISTIAHADVISESMVKPGLNSLIIAQKPEDETLGPHRARARLFHAQTQNQWKPELITDAAHLMQFGWFDERHNLASTSRIYFGTSGSASIGRGETLHRMIVEEFGEWDDKEATAIFQMAMGLPHDSRVIVIGTPKSSRGAFRSLCEGAMSGTNGFKLHVLPWFWETDYALPTLPLTYTAEESALASLHGLTMEQIAWRRQQILLAGASNPNSPMSVFLQEYLENPYTCWAYAGTPLFDNEYLLSIDALATPPIHITHGGSVRIWELPRAGTAYVIGADPAEGLTTSHLSAAVVRKVIDGQHVATIRGQISPSDFARLLSQVGMDYNNALINVERDNHGGTVIMALQEIHTYPNLYVHYKDVVVGGDGRVGFPMKSSISRLDTISNMKDYVNTKQWTSPDREVLSAFMRFEEEDGKYHGEDDDLVFAEFHCNSAKDQAVAIMPGNRRKSEAYGPAWLRRL